jgi:hypothetical protein
MGIQPLRDTIGEYRMFLMTEIGQQKKAGIRVYFYRCNYRYALK